MPELHAMLESLLEESREVGLFGVSLGACFGLMAAADLPLCQALLVSPVVDMPGLIEGMMQAAGVTPEQLEREKVIPVDVYKRQVTDIEAGGGMDSEDRHSGGDFQPHP